MKDWWYDLPKYISNIKLNELYMHENRYVFTLYETPISRQLIYK